MASDRLLEHIKKGVSIAQVARVIKGFADQGILVHAYLMCGFPTETVQATVDSLEVVRLLFTEGCLHLGYWHRLEATGHSPIGMEPEQFGIQLRPNRTASNRVFARYPIPFKDPTGVDHAPWTRVSGGRCAVTIMVWAWTGRSTSGSRSRCPSRRLRREPSRWPWQPAPGPRLLRWLERWSTRTDPGALSPQRLGAEASPVSIEIFLKAAAIVVVIIVVVIVEARNN